MKQDGTEAEMKRYNRTHGTCRVITPLGLALLGMSLGLLPAPAQDLIEYSLVKVYVTNTGSGTVSVLGGGGVPVGLLPMAVVAAPGADTAYVGNFGSGTVSVINGATLAVTATIPVGSGPRALALHPTKLYAANFGSGTVTVINRSTNTVMGTIPVGAGPSALRLVLGDAYLIVVNATSNTVSVIDTATNAVVDTLPVGDATVFSEVASSS